MTRRSFSTLLLLALGLGLPSPAFAAAGGPGAAKAAIVAGAETDYPPFSIVAGNGKADGFSVELFAAAVKAAGRDVVFRTGVWSDLKRDLAEGRLQALPLVGRTPEREALYEFTFPYLAMHGTIVVRRGNDEIRGPENLTGRQVAVLKGDNAEEFLNRARLGATIVPLPSFETALRELSAGRHDAVVMQKLVALQLMKSARIENLKTVGKPLEDFSQQFCFAVRAGDHELLSTLNEGLALVMADGTFRRLQTKWFGPLEARSRPGSRVVVGGDNDYPPYEYLDRNGQPAGFNVELTRAVARQAGIDVDFRLGAWGKIRKGLESGEIDLVQGMFYSVERDEAYDFSPPYTVVAHTIVVRNGSPVPADLASLSGRSVLVMAGDVMEDLAVERGLGKNLVAVASQEEALRLLAAGRHDCALVAAVPALYWIEKHGWRNLRLADTPVFSAEYGYAALPANASLLSSMSEGLAAIQKTGEYRTLRNQWLGPYEERKAFRTVARYALAVLLPLLALLFGSVLWSRSLRRQVVARTREVSMERELLSAEAEKVRTLNEELEGRVAARTAELESAVGEMEAFSYSVAHDLRAPVRAVDGFAAILASDYAGSLDDEGRRLLEKVRLGSRRMGQLIDDLLAFSRTSRTAMTLAPVDLTRVARSVVSELGAEAARAAVEVRLSELPAALGDEGLLRVVFQNLVSNAIKFSAGRPGATVVIASRAGERGTEYFVEDNGVGFDAEFVHKLFGVFQRLHRADEFEGTGIGLALVKRIVERHGGRVWAEGEVGRGATVRFTLSDEASVPSPVRAES
ncbi:MAG: transporter substrate-binding domain-containing protein [Holophagales bacterium]|nr:transporter substrate-binding domain-containing protein [Holophagales bacterium]